MYLVIDNGQVYVTNSDERTLRLARSRNPGFHFEPIPFYEVSIVHKRSSETQAIIDELAAASRKHQRQHKIPTTLTPAQRVAFDEALRALEEEL